MMVTAAWARYSKIIVFVLEDGCRLGSNSLYVVCRTRPKTRFRLNEQSIGGFAMTMAICVFLFEEV
jgi:RNA:NAD 2'-phosphotransferase (TPT1/KptA family)